MEVFDVEVINLNVWFPPTSDQISEYYNWERELDDEKDRIHNSVDLWGIGSGELECKVCCEGPE